MKEFLNNKSWKTTAAGIAGFLILVGENAQAMVDGSAAKPDWSTVAAGFVVLLMGYLARDNNRTSESVGAK